MTARHNSVRIWAVAVVALIGAFLIGLSIWLTSILSAGDWCNRALGAAKYVEGAPEYAIGGCFNLLQRQLAALALNSHIAIGVLAVCLAVLVVIVLAQGRLSGRAGADGASIDIGGGADTIHDGDSVVVSKEAAE